MVTVTYDGLLCNSNKHTNIFFKDSAIRLSFYRISECFGGSFSEFSYYLTCRKIVDNFNSSNSPKPASEHLFSINDLENFFYPLVW